jgi:sec-independent protein translocase protein TatB
MFDIGFSEIMVIAVVALIVIGPERLPKTARTLGHLFGRLQRYVNEVKADINREMELDELRKLQQQVRSAAQEIETSVSTAAKDVEAGVRTVESELNAAGEAAVASPPAAEMLPLAPPPAEPAPAGRAPAPAAPAPAEASRQATLPGFERG